MPAWAPLRSRFEAKVARIPFHPCWEWAAGKNASGYGVIGRDGKSRLAHRVSYELHVGPIPDGLCVLHRCDNPGCVRPEHLFLGTRADNKADEIAKGRNRHGERAPNHKLTAAQVREIRASRETQRALGRRFGVSGTAIWRIRAKEKWRATV